MIVVVQFTNRDNVQYCRFDGWWKRKHQRVVHKEERVATLTQKQKCVFEDGEEL